ncbi:PREDICTED: L-xylulose reductase [Nicrophorus vespilloides]|uniref:L-xylulose reductase n=1 Tax=Nicrophorus vespilloides TaxID=110193 RepID=A0ABM1MW25_NICVS|nr:PREDICTED: L-xylulose reductase [Nicrophorus vespilloides]
MSALSYSEGKMNITFHGRKALVTGASQGIGRDIALKLSQYGAKVTAIARNQQLLDVLHSEDPKITVFAVDLSNWDATKNVLSQIGSVDLLVNNAGLAILAPLLDVTEQQIDSLFGVNVKALMNVTQHVAKDLISRGAAGSIVNVSSQASMAGLQDHTVYCATKGAVDAFTRAAALELGKFGIRVNCVNPTVIMTEMGKLGWSDPAKAKPMLEKIPLGRFGEVEEVTDAVLYLLSDRSTMITGSTLAVDGGYLAV